jgi:hypothetical protein
MSDSALVRDTSDPRQHQHATRTVKSRRGQELADLRAVLAEPAGRRFVWRLLERVNTFASIWEQSAKIHYNAGQQDVGHFLMAEINEADDTLLFQMMQDARARTKKEARENASAPSRTDEDGL